jgi:hypothetical protein
MTALLLILHNIEDPVKKVFLPAQKKTDNHLLFGFVNKKKSLQNELKTLIFVARRGIEPLLPG